MGAIDPASARPSSKLSFEGKRPEYHGELAPRNAHWTDKAMSGIETTGRVIGAAGTVWQIGRGVVQAGKVLGPILAAI